MNDAVNEAVAIQRAAAPLVYAYQENTDAEVPWSGKRPGGRGRLKVGYTQRASAFMRVNEIHGVDGPEGISWTILVEEPAQRDDGQYFNDHVVHDYLENKMGVQRLKGEWFECTKDEVLAAIRAVRKDPTQPPPPPNDYKMRPEQEEAVRVTAEYFTKVAREQKSAASKRSPHFLWNAKMRFGKTFTTYQLAKEQKWKRILVLTFKPAVEGEWRNQLEQHVDFKGWQFRGGGEELGKYREKDPLVWFVSFQDIGGKNKAGLTKERLQSLYGIEWDCVVLDEYHFGAWNDRAKELYEDPLEEDESAETEEIEDRLALKAHHYLYLTGTPFRALMNGEFLEDQIYSWSYSDEQKAKREWDPKVVPNPYEDLPNMVMFVYDMPEEARQIALKGEMNEFDLNEFFRAERNKTNKEKVKFVHANQVQMWLDSVIGQYRKNEYEPREGVAVPVGPFENADLLSNLTHTLWFLPSVEACDAMADLLKKPQNTFFQDYEVIVAAGTKAGIGLAAVKKVQKEIGNGLRNKSITLTFAKLTTGVTIPQWSGVFMLRNTSNPETYFQTAFRVQNPWVLREYDPTDPNAKFIRKRTGFIFDYAPTRALQFVSQYAERLNINGSPRPEERVQEFLNFLPVLSYQGGELRQIDAGEVLDIASSGFGMAMLTKKWRDPRMVTVNITTLTSLHGHPELIAALKRIEQFRRIPALEYERGISQSINTTEELKKAKREGKEPSKKVSEEEKKNRGFRKEVKERLMWLVARIPVFMYLTENREETLKDVIMQLETDLFTRVTGINLEEFKRFCDIGVFNARTMNDGVWQFRLAEEGSLHYAGGREYDLKIGGWDTTVSRDEAIEIVGKLDEQLGDTKRPRRKGKS